MFSWFSPARAALFSASLIAASIPASVNGADLFGSLPPAPPVDETPVEFGSGWYLRGDVGYTQLESTKFVPNGSTAGVASWNVGGGYQINNWLRAEVAVDRAVFKAQGRTDAFWCPYDGHWATWDNPVTGKNEKIGAVQILSETCTGLASTNVDRTSGMFNGYIDLGTWSGLTPYVGAGLGVSYLQNTSNANYFKNSDGTRYAPDLTPPGDGYVFAWFPQFGDYYVVRDANGVATNAVPYPLVPQPGYQFTRVTLDQKRQTKVWKFAWNLMAGVSYDISQNLKADLGYRFLNSGTVTVPSGLPGWPASSQSMISHEIRLGLRVSTD